jgi:hypothetical protein
MFLPYTHTHTYIYITTIAADLIDDDFDELEQYLASLTTPTPAAQGGGDAPLIE